MRMWNLNCQEWEKNQRVIKISLKDYLKEGVEFKTVY